MHSDLESLTLDPILVIFKLAQFLPKMIDLLFTIVKICQSKPYITDI